MNRFLILIVFLSTFSLHATAQALQGGNFEVHGGLGFGFFGVSSNDYEDNTDVGVPGLISLGLSYQISNSFALGLNFERNGFLTDPDSNNKAVSNNIGIVVLYNVVNSEKDAIALSLELGGSSFRFDDFKNEDYVTSQGSQFKLGTKWKHFFNDHLGFYLKLNLASYSYDNFENEDGDQLKVYRFNNIGFILEERVYEISMVGMNFGFGLTYKM